MEASLPLRNLCCNRNRRRFNLGVSKSRSLADGVVSVTYDVGAAMVFGYETSPSVKVISNLAFFLTQTNGIFLRYLWG